MLPMLDIANKGTESLPQVDLFGSLSAYGARPAIYRFDALGLRFIIPVPVTLTGDKQTSHDLHPAKSTP
jgi:hypothetical protein